MKTHDSHMTLTRRAAMQLEKRIYAGDYPPDTPLQLMKHLAVKLALNTVSTGTMAVLGRVTGNWMSWVDTTNKKLIDRAARLIAEIGGMDYRSACIRLFEAMETLEQTRKRSEEKTSAVQYVLRQLGR